MIFDDPAPSYRHHNVRDLDPGRVNCQTRVAAPRAQCIKVFSKIYEIPRACAAWALCASSRLSTRQCSRIHCAIVENVCIGQLGGQQDEEGHPLSVPRLFAGQRCELTPPLTGWLPTRIPKARKKSFESTLKELGSSMLSPKARNLFSRA